MNYIWHDIERNFFYPTNSFYFYFQRNDFSSFKFLKIFFLIFIVFSFFLNAEKFTDYLEVSEPEYVLIYETNGLYTFDEANGISTIDDYMDKMALMSNWGARDNVSIAKIPAGTEIKYAVGTAREQIGAIESRPGGGLQMLFEQFDDSWVLETRPMP